MAEENSSSFDWDNLITTLGGAYVAYQTSNNAPAPATPVAAPVQSKPSTVPSVSILPAQSTQSTAAPYVGAGGGFNVRQLMPLALLLAAGLVAKRVLL